MAELTTVADDEAVIHDGSTVRRITDLAPDTDHEIDGFSFRTLPDLGGRLATVTTVNDVHFGETECGVIEGLEVGPIFRSAPGEPPYPDLMNQAAIAEMAAVEPDAVIVKGDLTCRGTQEEYEAFLATYEPAFGERLVHVRGNHDGYFGESYAAFPTQRVDLPGVTLAVLDTTDPGQTPGRVTGEQLAWLDDLGAEADRPVLLFGHHHVWSPDSAQRPDTYFGILPDPSEALVEIVARHPRILGYFAGHTHRNRVRRIAATGDRPWTEVACVKDYPGTWAEYRVHEGGVLQVHRRISDPAALAWTEQTRDMYAGTYAGYALGSLADRCFAMRAP
ncbi:MAG: metallophosphoesterase [Acidimicrobiales bacterium]|nr:metallophosphoesterase [Acidimicrobiales bacterium]